MLLRIFRFLLGFFYFVEKIHIVVDDFLFLLFFLRIFTQIFQFLSDFWFFFWQSYFFRRFFFFDFAFGFFDFGFLFWRFWFDLDLLRLMHAFFQFFFSALIFEHFYFRFLCLHLQFGFLPSFFSFLIVSTLVYISSKLQEFQGLCCGTNFAQDSKHSVKKKCFGFVWFGKESEVFKKSNWRV